MKYGKWFLSFALVCLVVALFGVPGALAETTEDGWEYQISDGNVTITGYSGTDTVLTIPSMIDENPVTAIGNSAFQDCTGLERVNIGSVVSIWALDTMKWGNASGLMIGRADDEGNTVLAPDGQITRIEMAVLFYRWCTEFAR